MHRFHLSRAMRLPLAVLILGLCISVFCARWLAQRNGARFDAEFDSIADRIQLDLRERLRHPVYGLRGLAGLYAASPRVDNGMFRAFVGARDLPREFRGVRGFGFIQLVQRQEVDAFVAAERADGEPDFAVREFESFQHADQYVIKFIEPRKDNQGAKGLDIGSEGRRRVAADRAIASGETTLTAPITLVQDKARRAGFLLFLPIYRQGAEVATPAQRREALVGLLYAPIVVSELLEGLLSHDVGQISVELRDVQATGPDGPALYAAGSTEEASGAAHVSTHSVTIPFAIHGREFKLTVRSTALFDGHEDRGAPWLVLVVGALVSSLLAGLLLQAHRSRRHAERAKNRMTSEVDRLALVAQRTSNAVVITDAQQKITWVNDGFERITGYSAADVIGLTPTHLVQFDGTDAATIARLHSALNRGEGFHCELLNRGKHGRIYWVELEIQPLHNRAGGLIGFMAIESDITDRRALQAQVERSAQVLRSAIDAIDEAFVLYDPEDRLVLCNEKYRALYAQSADLIRVGARFEDIVRGGAERGQYKAAVGRVDEWVAERMAHHRAGNTTLVQHLNNGRVVRVVERRMPDGHLVGFRVDITDFVRATEAAEQASQAKSEFIATISHELRTPLQSVIGFSELGENFAQEQPSFRAMFADINAGGQRMLKLVNDLLDISKFTGSLVLLELRPGDLAEVCAAVVGEFAPIAARASVHIELPLPRRPMPVAMDSFRMQQVLRNVLANAVRFTRPGSRIRVDLTNHGEHGVAVSVSDDGPGIPEDELDDIFEPFTQSSRTRDGSGGTGLGLTICRKIMTAHGGTIEATNAAGRGALITIRLPALAPVPQELPHEIHHSDH